MPEDIRLLSEVLPPIETMTDTPWHGYPYRWQYGDNSAHRLLGLDHDSLEREKKRFDEFRFKCRYRWSLGGTLDIMYVPFISFAKTFFKGVAGRRIVEVGAGETGAKPLAYLAAEGAETMALDCDELDQDVREFMKMHGTGFLPARWEKMGSQFDPETLDMIYVKFMHPNPESTDEFGYTSSEFEQKISDEMKRVLKKRGVFVLHNNDDSDFPPDYAISRDGIGERFVKNGFDYYLFRLPCFGTRLHLFQKVQA